MTKIIADSTCDLSQEILEKYSIDMAPLTINIKGRSYKDKIDLQPNDFFMMMKDLEEYPTTAMPSPTEFLDIIHQAIEHGHTEILCICMSSGTSGSYQSAAIAKDDFYQQNPNSHIKIHVVDSQCMSHGSGWLILKSARLREQGATFEELVDFNETYKTCVKHYLCVDDLNHLIKSGRISNTGALIGKVLNIKPIMSMKKGKGAIVAKERGRKRVLSYYVNNFIKRNAAQFTDFIIIGYTTYQTIAEELKKKLRETDFTGEIFIMQMGVAVGTHVGPGGLSMFHMENRTHIDMDSALLKRLKKQ